MPDAIEFQELKQRVDKLERQVASLLESSRLAHGSSTTASTKVMDLVRQRRTLDAIKAYREESGVGLAEAKQFIDSLVAR